MALAIDASTPAFKTGGVSGITITSSTFSPPAGSLLCVIAAGAGTNSMTAASITDSLGSHLTWTKRAEALNGGSTASETLWVADCPSAQTNMTVTVTYGQSGSMSTSDGSIAVIVFTGAKAAASQTGGTATQTSSVGLPTMTVSATAAGSQIVGGWWNWTDSTAPTVPTGQTTTFNGHVLTYSDASGSYSWVQQITAQTTGSGSKTINDTAPSGKQLSGVAAEILAASGGSGLTLPATLVNWPQAMWRSAYR